MTDLKKFNAASLLPHRLIDPQLASKVTSAFLRGEYDLAVLVAFREVEITVRELGNFSTGDIGVSLMRKAFRPSNGPLTDTQQDPGEQVPIPINSSTCSEGNRPLVPIHSVHLFRFKESSRSERSDAG